MPDKDLKARIQDVLIALKHLFVSDKSEKSETVEPQKVLDKEALDRELAEFARINGYDLNNPNFDMNEFKAKLTQYLEDRNYCFSALDVGHVSEKNDSPVQETNDGDVTESGNVKIPRHISKISEKLNDYIYELSFYIDTTKMMPGMVVYTVEKVGPTDEKPYVTYRPSPRIITQIHDSGVNGGTIFFTYNHKFISVGNFSDGHRVISEEEVIYSPLTKEAADFLCKELNAQSRMLYRDKMKELAALKQTEMLVRQKQKTK